jgi:hypothetical protein
MVRVNGRVRSREDNARSISASVPQKEGDSVELPPVDHHR